MQSVELTFTDMKVKKKFWNLTGSLILTHLCPLNFCCVLHKAQSEKEHQPAKTTLNELCGTHPEVGRMCLLMCAVFESSGILTLFVTIITVDKFNLFGACSSWCECQPISKQAVSLRT